MIQTEKVRNCTFQKRLEQEHEHIASRENIINDLNGKIAKLENELTELKRQAPQQTNLGQTKSLTKKPSSEKEIEAVKAKIQEAQAALDNQLRTALKEKQELEAKLLLIKGKYREIDQVKKETLTLIEKQRQFPENSRIHSHG